MTTSLKHVGVLGMKWGHRKTKENESEIVRRKGEELHTVNFRETLDLKDISKTKRALYTSFTEKDVLTYRSMFSDQLKARHNVNVVYDHTLSAKEDLVSPNKKKRIDSLIELYKDNKDIVNEMGKSKITASFFLTTARSFGFDKHKEYASNYRKLLDSKNPKDQEKAFRDFSAFLPLSDKGRTAYFNKLSKEGFNSIYDDNDIYAGFSQRPLIVFNPSKSLKTKDKMAIDEKAGEDAFTEWEQLN